MKESLASVFLDHLWLIEIILLVAGFSLLNRLFIRMVRRGQEKSMEKKSDTVELLHSVLLPGRVLLGVLLVSFCFQIIAQKFPSFDILSFIVPLRNIGIVFCLCWWLFRWKSWLFKLLSKRLGKTSLPFDFTFLEISGKVLNIVILCVAFLVVLQIFGLDIVPFVTFGGVGAAAIGFAGKDIIANYVTGFMLYATRPFTVGDLIEIPDKDIRGHVEEIGWCLTSIRDLHKKPIFVPNTLFSSTILMNISRMSHRCFHETISVRYNDISKIPALLEGIQNIFKAHPKVDQKLPIFVFFKTFGPYSLNIETRVYVMTSLYKNYMEVKQKLLMDIHKLVEENSAKIAYPTSVMKMERLNPEEA